MLPTQSCSRSDHHSCPSATFVIESWACLFRVRHIEEGAHPMIQVPQTTQESHMSCELFFTPTLGSKHYPPHLAAEDTGKGIE